MQIIKLYVKVNLITWVAVQLLASEENFVDLKLLFYSKRVITNLHTETH